MIYTSIESYLAAATAANARLQAIETLIDSLLLAAAEGATVANKSEYSLNDGQTTLRVVYKDVASIMASIKALEQMKARIINNSTGRMVQLRDGKNFI